MFKDFAVPTRIARVETEEELLKYINRYNGVLNIYTSIYWYDIISIDEFGNEIRKSKIDKVYFDIDHDVESTKKLVNYLLSEDLKFHINFSGRGHHIYITAEGDATPSNLRIAQLSIINTCKASVDMHIIGNPQQISRIPNSWNFSGGKFCIPIKVEEIGKEDGSTQRFEKFEYGHKILDLTSFTEEKFEYIKPEIIRDMEINTNIALIPCISNIVKKINPNNVERYCLVIFLSNAIRNGKDLRGFDRQIIAEQIMAFFEENASHWLDWDPQFTAYQIRNIVPKSNIVCGCKFLKEKNVCINCIPGGL